MKKSLYATLGVDPKASDSEIQAAYARCVAAAAPDDKVRHMVLKEALSVLGHSQRRAVYDASLLEQARAQEAAPRADSRRNSVGGSPSRPHRRAAAESATGSGSKVIWVAGAVIVLAAGWLLTRSHKAPASQGGAAQKLAASSTRILGDGSQALTPVAPQATNTAHGGRALKAEELYAKASASIVRINVANASDEGVALGSGVVIERGTVITNCHVAKAGARLKVKHQDNAYDATLTLADEQHDLCKLSVTGLDAPAASLGTVNQVQVGQKVYALGAPQGLDLTLSDGMVSSLRKFDEGTVIQTSAPVSPGSSGGGLFNEQGQLIGIITFQMRSGQNLNFAVPADWIGTMSSTTLTSADRSGTGSASGSTTGVSSDLVGTWHCFGPLTGRGMDVTFDSQGNVNGSFDGQPISGRYQLLNQTLSMMGHVFTVEELSASRMVISKGQGRRLACTH